MFVRGIMAIRKHIIHPKPSRNIMDLPFICFNLTMPIHLYTVSRVIMYKDILLDTVDTTAIDLHIQDVLHIKEMSINVPLYTVSVIPRSKRYTADKISATAKLITSILCHVRCFLLKYI
jgi:hypothetical protein